LKKFGLPKRKPVDTGAIVYAVEMYRPKSDVIPGLQAIKDSADYSAYKAGAEKPLPKFKYLSALGAELMKLLNKDIVPLRG